MPQTPPEMRGSRDVRPTTQASSAECHQTLSSQMGSGHKTKVTQGLNMGADNGETTPTGHLFTLKPVHTEASHLHLIAAEAFKSVLCMSEIELLINVIYSESLPYPP